METMLGQSLAWIDQLQVEPLSREPIEQLAPYLSGIDLTIPDEQLDQLAGYYTGPEVSEWSYSENANSPQWFASCFSSPSQGRSVCSSSSSSWPPSSPASVCSSARSGSRSRHGPNKSAGSSKLAPTRKSPNATAAERYRLKLKRGQCNLAELVEIEKARNAALRRDLESKLELYREFVHLLAANLRDQDDELALLGCQSLESTLAGSEMAPSTCSYKEHESDSESASGGSDRSYCSSRRESGTNIHQIDCELRAHLGRFKQLAGSAQFGSQFAAAHRHQGAAGFHIYT